MVTNHNSRLAIDGGTPLRTRPMPVRRAIGVNERAMLLEALDYYDQRGLDPGYEGVFEQRYCKAFADLMGGGYADAVATGTASLFVAVAALGLPAGSEVLVSPVTDPGSISAIIMNGTAGHRDRPDRQAGSRTRHQGDRGLQPVARRDGAGRARRFIRRYRRIFHDVSKSKHHRSFRRRRVHARS